MGNTPYWVDIPLPGGVPSRFDNRIERRLSSMRGQYLDHASYAQLLERADVLLYEVYENVRPNQPGDLIHGVSIVHPGKVGDEYFMTKGHYHALLETAEVYYCLAGRGMMVLQTQKGDWATEELLPGRLVYVPPCWAHRSVNTADDEDLVTLFVYPANAGHDYGTIEGYGFCKRVVERDGRPVVVDNPSWHA
jgi:glucose-6-phosphate isomerase